MRRICFVKIMKIKSRIQTIVKPKIKRIRPETCNDLSFRKSRNKAADPGSDRDDRQDNAYEIAKTEIVALFRHKAILSFWDFILLLYSKITEMSTFCKK